MNALKVRMYWDGGTMKGTLQIIDQKFRGDEFNKGNNFFKGSTGFKLLSCDYPEYYLTDQKLFVRGRYTEKDDLVIKIYNKNAYKDISKTIQEYNAAMMVDDDLFEETKAKFLKNIDEYAVEFLDYVERNLEEMKTATSMDELMACKKQFLVSIIIGQLPLGTEQCPYCVKHSGACSVCEYGKTHGICTEIDSLYRKIQNAKRNLVDTIRENY